MAVSGPVRTNTTPARQLQNLPGSLRLLQQRVKLAKGQHALDQDGLPAGGAQGGEKLLPPEGRGRAAVEKHRRHIQQLGRPPHPGGPAGAPGSPETDKKRLPLRAVGCNGPGQRLRLPLLQEKGGALPGDIGFHRRRLPGGGPVLQQKVPHPPVQAAVPLEEGKARLLLQGVALGVILGDLLRLVCKVEELDGHVKAGAVKAGAALEPPQEGAEPLVILRQQPQHQGEQLQIGQFQHLPHILGRQEVPRLHRGFGPGVDVEEGLVKIQQHLPAHRLRVRPRRPVGIREKTGEVGGQQQFAPADQVRQVLLRRGIGRSELPGVKKAAEVGGHLPFPLSKAVYHGI